MPETRVPMPGGSATPADEGNRALSEDELRPFPFLKLPLELRRDVYNYALIQDKQPLRLTQKTEADGEFKNDPIAILTTNRQVNLEAYPIFLSVNALRICGTKKELQWLKKLGPDGQKALRKVLFCNGYIATAYSLPIFRTLNVLAGCPQISLTIKIHFFQIVALYHTGFYGYLHGFSRATFVDCKESRERCSDQSFRRPFADTHDYGGKCIQRLLEQLSSACPKNCKVHKAKAEPHSAGITLVICRCGA